MADGIQCHQMSGRQYCKSEEGQLLHCYTMNHHTLEVVDHTIYLGVAITHNLYWDRQINTMTSKANHTLGCVYCNLYACDRDIKSAAYKCWYDPIESMHQQSGFHTLSSIRRRLTRSSDGQQDGLPMTTREPPV